MDIKRFVIWWNNNFPLDYWWRTKHNIPFNSSNHREVDFIDQKFEYEEEKIYKDIRDKSKQEKEDMDNADKPYHETGLWLRPKKDKDAPNQEMSWEEFENISWEELEND